MKRFALLLSTLTAGVAAAATEAEYDCRSFLAPAERYYALPPGLLGAMAMVESGYGGAPYPWALNIGGEPVMAADYAAAARLLRDRDGRIRRDVAIGCLQIHMGYHLNSFGAPEWALLPRYNVWYAALFLRQLGVQYGDWVMAIAHYHASDPEAEARYLCQVAGQLQKQAPLTRRLLGLALCGAVTAERPRAVPRQDAGGSASARR